MLKDECLEVVVCPVDTTFGVDLMVTSSTLSRFQFALSGQVNISCFQRALIDQTIDGAAADRQRVAARHCGMVYRLTLENQGSDLLVHLPDLIRSQVETCP